MTVGRILIVEDSASLAMSYALQMEAAGHAADIAASGAAARALITGGLMPYDVVLLDLQLPDCDGLELLESLPDLTVESSVIVVTADGSIKRAINAMRLGAYDFLVKPLATERLITTVRNAVERRALTQEVKIVRKLVTRDSFEGFIGRSPVMQAVYRAIENVADSKATVFITGESGTGKEVAAEAIHRSGRRGKRPFVAINCGAIPEHLLESELFGHIKGAFTGAVENPHRRRKGSRWRYAVSRRDLRDGTQAPGEAAALPPDRNDSARRHQPAGGRRRARRPARPTATPPPKSPPAGSARICSTASR